MNARSSSGMMFIDVVIAILIIGILASIAVPRMNDVTTSANDAMEKSTLAAIERGIEFQRLKDAVS